MLPNAAKCCQMAAGFALAILLANPPYGGLAANGSKMAADGNGKNSERKKSMKKNFSDPAEKARLIFSTNFSTGLQAAMRKAAKHYGWKPDDWPLHIGMIQEARLAGRIDDDEAARRYSTPPEAVAKRLRLSLAEVCSRG